MSMHTRNGAWPMTEPVRIDRGFRPSTGNGEADRSNANGRNRGEAASEASRVASRTAEALTPARRRSAVLDRERILLATAACLDEWGYDGTTIRRIATRLDCAVGSIYRYYADKRELLTAVCEHRFEPVREAAAHATPAAFAGVYLTAARERPESYRLMFWLAALSPEAARQPLPTVVDRILACWTQRLGSRSEALRMWFSLHGRATLGEAPSDREAAELEASTIPEQFGQASNNRHAPNITAIPNTARDEPRKPATATHPTEDPGDEPAGDKDEAEDAELVEVAEEPAGDDLTLL